jgi:hypothetical protein
MRQLLSLALCLALAACTSMQTGAQAQDPSRVQRDLYQDALQSIAEGRRNDASRELREQIEREPLHAGAWLDLALTQCALGHSDEAERLFATIETRFAPAQMTPGWEDMLRLIAEAREEGCNHWHPSSAWSVTIGRGIDQNVNQGALSSVYVTNGADGPTMHELSSDFLPMHDQYTLLAGDFMREISSNGTTAFVQYAARRNDQLHQYDSGAAFGGVEMPSRLGHWSLRSSATAGLITLNGSLYQRQVALQTRVAPPLPLPAGLQFNAVLGVTNNQFVTLTNFNSNVWEARAQLIWRKTSHYASFSLGRLNDHALAQRPGGNRQGWFANSLLRQRVGERLTGELGFVQQDWSSALPYAPGIIEELRAQRTSTVRASLIYAINKVQSVQLEARSVHNRENISIFQYNDRQLQLSWQWQGF